jgi:Zn-dependent protease
VTLAVAFDSPVMWAVLIGWIITVVLHEFAHGLVAYLSGDYTIRERGGLTLNPLQFIEPLNSIILPAVFLALGGIPLPGGVTYVRRDLIHSRFKNALVSAAGPITNFILFILLILPFHPAFRLVNPNTPIDRYPTWQIFLAALAQLQFIACILNLVPIPPLDGFNILAPYMDDHTRTKLMSPQLSTMGLVIFFFVLWEVPAVIEWIFHLSQRFEMALGFDYSAREMLRRGFNIALFGHTD